MEKLGLTELEQRRRGERVDSVTTAIIVERARHLERLQEDVVFPGGHAEEHASALRLLNLGLGRKKVGNDRGRMERHEVGAAGACQYLASAAKPAWPRFTHALPEVALAGHSNCGKSTLLNALAGLTNTKGLAKVSDRAGWTDALFWYQMGHKPPTLALVDLPGYGHAVAGELTKKRWASATRDFLLERKVMATICVLVDATRGVADDDAELLALLHAAQRPHRLVLTKGDLLGAAQLARCVQLVQGDWQHLRQAADRARGQASPAAAAGAKAPAVACVSGHTGAGVTALWKSLVAAAQRVSVYKDGPNGVPTHVSAVA